MKPMLTQEDYDVYKTALDNNWEGLTGLDEHVYVRMFGYRDIWHYYSYITLAD